MLIPLLVASVLRLTRGQDWGWGENTIAKPLLPPANQRPLFETARPLRGVPPRGRPGYEVYEFGNDGDGGNVDRPFSREREILAARPGGGFGVSVAGPGGVGVGLGLGNAGGSGPEEAFPPPLPPPVSNERQDPSSIIPDQRPGVLTGPIPSWQEPFTPADPTNFDTCKCVHSFNCKSPSLQFGRCDVGKQYCCYNNKKPGPLNMGIENGYGPKFDPVGKGLILSGPNNPESFRSNFPSYDLRVRNRFQDRSNSFRKI